MSFSNEKAGKFWDEYNKYNRPKTYASKLRKDYKPKLTALPSIGKKSPKGSILYVTKIYSYCADFKMRNRRKIRKKRRRTEESSISSFDLIKINEKIIDFLFIF